MPHPAAPLLAADFGHLRHTNNHGETGLIHMPGYMTAGMNPEQAETVGALAETHAEAIIETLQYHGYQVLSKDQLDAHTAAHTAQDTQTEVTLHCQRCRRPIIKVNTTATTPTVRVTTLTEGLQAHTKVCR